MSEGNQTNLNWLQEHLPEGLIADAAWLERHGYYSSLREKYLSSGWLERLAHGVFRRPPAKLGENGDTTLRWQHVVISLQTILELPIIVGGRTALELQGFGHYVRPAGPHDIQLYGDVRAPSWLFKLHLEQRFIFRYETRLFRNKPITRALTSLMADLKTGDNRSADPIHGGLTTTRWGTWDWPLTLSTPERAILELFADVPRRETFHQADAIMEGLTSLSPRRLNRLLADCRSVKVKRLFMWFADRHNHAWSQHLDRDAIDLGRGKRQLVEGGRLDPTYLITVPENLDAGG